MVRGTAKPDLPQAIRDKALALGFDLVALTPARLDGKIQAGLADFVARGHHGDMAWLANTMTRRADPRVLWPEARSAVMLGMSYAPEADPLALLGHPERASIASYARGQDYHALIKKRLKALARWLAAEAGAAVKVFVDTAPLMEKPLAEAAGIGWQGKHTNLVSRRHGSWLFLGAVLTDLDLSSDPPESDHCGACRRCLDICPTAAFPEPYRLDARRCISYLTIEHKGHIAREFRQPMGNRIFGCDDCLAICPWNKFARRTSEPNFMPRIELAAPRLADLAMLDDAGFRAFFAGTSVKRIGRSRFMRNLLIAIGNSGDSGLAPRAVALLDDPSPLVRAMAVWALGRLLDPGSFAALRANRLPTEQDQEVCTEWRQDADQSTQAAE
jgi:epoxyqueuosine reductase